MKRTHTLLATTLVASVVTLGVLGGPGAQAAPAPGRGTVLSSTQVQHLGIEGTKAFLREGGYSAAEVRRPVIAHRIVYRTIGANGRPIRASGLVAFPTSGPHHLKQVLFAHGTTPSKAAAPSVGTDDSYHQAGALAFAAAGYAVVAPDYLGLGVGAGRPAYLDTRTEVSASLDLLKAARTFAKREGRTLSRGVRVAGFSQGAHTTLTVARAIQEGRAGRLRLAAVAPISGAYSFRDAELPAIVAGEVDPKLATLYLGYLFTSWDRLHGLYGSPSKVFRGKYAGLVEDLYDGSHSPMEVYTQMPDTPKQLFTPAGMRMIKHPTGRFAAALDRYDSACSGWAPKAPMRMYYTAGDREAVPANTLHCVADFARRGYPVQTRDLATRDHTKSGAVGVLASIRWFHTLGR